MLAWRGALERDLASANQKQQTIIQQPPPVYYYPPAPTYIEQYPGVPGPQSQDWYYCPNQGAYYPYVKDCPGGWQRVLPQQPTQPPPVG